jgi:hypothetical protein
MSAILKVLLSQLINLVVANVGGVQGWILKKVLQYGGQAAIDLFNQIMDSWKRKSAQTKAEEKKDEVVQNQDSTTQQIGEAYQDYFNSGREKK